MSQYEEGHNAELQARELGAILRDAALRDATVEHMAGEAERLRRAVTQIGRSNRPLTRSIGKGAWLLAAAALVLVLPVGAWVRQYQSMLPLAFEVVGPGRVSPSYVATPDSSSALLKFTDGSTVVAHQGTRLRVPELRLDGATLVLERGKAAVEVVHRDRSARWNVVAGPFTIAVTGTKFVVEWIPAAERFSVDMLEGRIEVDGPKFTAPATLRGGQRICANASEAGWAVTPLLEGNQPDGNRQSSERDLPVDGVEVARAQASAMSVASAVSSRPKSARPAVGAMPSGAASTSPVALASAAPLGEAKSWLKMVALGESQRVVSAAETLGVTTCLGQCSGSELRALADAARYTGRLELAEASLRALRERFPAQSAVAAYLLGAVDEARGRNASALRWYQEYVAAAPNGGFYSEALAGRLRMLVATNGYTSARKAAQQYLELYPSGVGARTAKQVLERR
jgi:hypothetical protein